MATIFKDIRAAIVAKAQTSTKLNKVYPSERSSFEGTPAAIVVPSEEAADYGDQATTQYDITFVIRVHQPMATKGQLTADEIIDDVLDELLEIFRDPKALGAACDWVQPVPASWGYQDRPEGQVRTGDLRIRCRKYLT